MMNESDQIACRYTTRIEQDGARYVIEVPDVEVEFGSLSAGGAYRITIEYTADQQTSETSTADTDRSSSQNTAVQAPVSEGDVLDVIIEDVGQQGDGIARVGPGYVLIVPGSDVGDELTVEVQQVTPSFGFAEIVDETGGPTEEGEDTVSSKDTGSAESVSPDDSSEESEDNSVINSATPE